MENEIPSIDKLPKYFENHKANKKINDFKVDELKIHLKVKKLKILILI